MTLPPFDLFGDGSRLVTVIPASDLSADGKRALGAFTRASAANDEHGALQHGIALLLHLVPDLTVGTTVFGVDDEFCIGWTHDGSALRLYVNGVEAGVITGQPPKGDWLVGLYGQSSGAECMTLFDDMIVRRVGGN